jgi:hypothetical protein
MRREYDGLLAEEPAFFSDPSSILILMLSTTGGMVTPGLCLLSGRAGGACCMVLSGETKVDSPRRDCGHDKGSSSDNQNKAGHIWCHSTTRGYTPRDRLGHQ